MFEVDLESGVGTSRFEGALTLADLMRSASTLWAHPDLPRAALLWDLRDATIELSASEVRQLAEFMKTRSPLTRPTRMAFVVSSDLAYGIVRMFEVFREDGAVGVRTFRDHAEAMAWLTG